MREEEIFCFTIEKRHYFVIFFFVWKMKKIKQQKLEKCLWTTKALKIILAKNVFFSLLFGARKMKNKTLKTWEMSVTKTFSNNFTLKCIVFHDFFCPEKWKNKTSKTWEMSKNKSSQNNVDWKCILF